MKPLIPFKDWPWQHWANLHPHSIALVVGSSNYSWRDVSLHIAHLAKYFAQQGLQPNQTVALRGKNSVELLFSQLAIIASGGKVLLVNPRLPVHLLDELVPHLDLNFVIDLSDDGIWSHSIAELEYPHEENIASSHDFQLVDFKQAKDWPATLILTSGSTGLPKAAVHNVLAHLYSAHGVVSAMNYQQQDCWLLSLPLFHVSGQGIVWRWLLRGAKLAMQTCSLNESLHDATLQSVTHASLVPTQLWRLLNEGNTTGLKLKEVLLGGAMIPTTLTNLASHRGIVCWSGYGMTEMASTVCAKRADGKPGVGLPLAGKQLRLVDDEIQIRADSQALGYWFDGVLQPLRTLDGWYQTNDKGAFIDGEYQILGRLDNLFISGGECVQPEDIEKIINSHPNVSQSFIIPIDDKEFGQRGVAVIELDNSSHLGSIATWLVDKLAPYQYPKAFYPLEAELKVGGIKVSRQQVKNWLLDMKNHSII